ncbi:hypothetical protein H8E06_00325 [bacterium]|nr:hypothetical protein [bacterium]
MKNKCAPAKRATLSEFRNGTWYTKMIEDNQTASPRSMSGRQTANQTVKNSHSLSELHKLRLERMAFKEERQKNIWTTYILAALLGCSLAFNIFFCLLASGIWL